MGVLGDRFLIEIRGDRCFGVVGLLRGDRLFVKVLIFWAIAVWLRLEAITVLVLLVCWVRSIVW